VELIDNIYKIYSRKEEELGVLAIEIELYIGEV
jgi:ASC-1-like (ASCH) protein